MNQEYNHPKHTKDDNKWSIGEIEEHEASLIGDNPCYYCLAEKS